MTSGQKHKAVRLLVSPNQQNITSAVAPKCNQHMFIGRNLRPKSNVMTTEQEACEPDGVPLVCLVGCLGSMVVSCGLVRVEEPCVCVRCGRAGFVVPMPCVFGYEGLPSASFGGHWISILSGEISGISQQSRVIYGGSSPQNTAKSIYRFGLAGGISTKSLVVVTGEVGVEHASASLGGPMGLGFRVELKIGATLLRRAPARQKIIQWLRGHDVASCTLLMPTGPMRIFEVCLITGGVFAWYSLDVGDGGTLHLSQCNAFQDGGGAYVGKGHVGYVQVHDLVATDCSASNGRGGGLFVEQGTVKLHRGNFTDCSAASSDGGAVYANGSMKAFHVEFISCTAKHTGGAAYIDSLEIGSAVFKSCAATQGRAVRANGLVEISDLAYLGKATQRSSGDFIKNAQASSLRIHSITCPRGSGVFADNTSTGCYVCDPGQVRLSHDVNDKCVACPDEPVTGCAETRMELRPGYMALVSVCLSMHTILPNHT